MSLWGAWADAAACKGLGNLMTMPPAGHTRQADILKAKQVCAPCPVYDDCYAWVIATTPDPCPQMIVAGLTLEERRTIRRTLATQALRCAR